jgi:hypothetical protein
MKRFFPLLIAILILPVAHLSAQFAFGPRVPVDTGIGFMLDLRAGDLDGDGDADLLTQDNQLPGSVYWYENTGAGFGPRQVVNDTVPFVNAVAIGDIDGDGLADVAFSYGSIITPTTGTWYQPGLGGGTFGAPRRIVDTLGGGCLALELVDMDADGDLDVLAGRDDYGDFLYLFINDGTGAFPDPPIKVAENVVGLNQVLATDIDGDGDLDVTFCAGLTGQVTWYEHDGALGFTGPNPVGLGSLSYPFAVAAEDLDGDGLQDLVFASLFDGVYTYRNVGPGGFFGFSDFEPGVLFTNDFLFNGAIVFSDFDGDGDRDAMVSSINADLFFIKENLGAAGFGPVQVVDSLLDAARNMVVEDFDGDGDMDVAIMSYGDGNLQYYPNEAAVSCSINSPVAGLDAAVGPTNVQLSWSALPGSVACQLKAERLVPPGPSPTANLLSPEADQFAVPLGLLGPGTTWSWRVRCACSVSPILATAFSAPDTFSVPVAREAVAAEMAIWPNPATEAVFLRIPDAGTLRILDPSGVERHVRELPEGLHRLDIDDWPSGRYTVLFDGRLRRWTGHLVNIE